MQNDNKRDFDAVAEKWDEEPRRLKLAQEVVAAMRRELPLTPSMQALDYGCGSGLVTLGLHPLVGRITGADSSRGMLEVLQQKIKERGLSNVSTVLLDLEHQKLEQNYDLIVSSMTLHHVQDVAGLITSLAQSLNPGGWLALADLESEDGSFHDDPKGVSHHGFSRAFLTDAFARCGLSELRVVTATTVDKKRENGAVASYPVLLCLGHK